MRWPALLTFAVVTTLLGIGNQPKPDACQLTVVLLDAETGQALPGLVQITDKDNQRLKLPELLDRGQGLPADSLSHQWSVLTKARTLTVPCTQLTIRAISGLETETVTRQVDLQNESKARVTLRLKRFHNATQQGDYSANTHLHLQKLTRQESDRYLVEVPQGDDLDILFVSYLERAIADRTYITNKYTAADLQRLSRSSPVLFGNGEEHRHNLAGFGQGYGHVMLLNIKQLIQPVSIGPGIMKTGTDGLPIQRGIDQARRDGGTIVWCHNNWGLEAIPNVATGRIDAQNIFDGGSHGSYRDSYYQYLNAGFRVPFSTGTDWFMYDFSRAYTRVSGKLTVENWLKALSAGRGYITNGPLIEFQVADQQSGATLSFSDPTTVKVRGVIRGRSDFGRLELISNGEVVGTAASRPVDGHYQADLNQSLDLKSSAWLALRTPPPPTKSQAGTADGFPTNLLGRQLFSHTNPVYVHIGGRIPFQLQAAEQLLRSVEQHRDTINRGALFADDQERSRVLNVYAAAAKSLKQHIRRHQNATASRSRTRHNRGLTNRSGRVAAVRAAG